MRLNTNAPMLSVSGLSLASVATGRLIVESVSFGIHSGEILGLVGESGSGKTSIALAILRLLPVNQIVVRSGQVLLQGVELLSLSEGDLSRIRGADVGMVFQEPLSSLNPVISCGVQAEDPLRYHTGLGRRARRKRALEAFDLVELDDPERIYRSFPGELSGGQRQRVLFAMAMIMHPKMLICDEPTTALDAPIKAEILSLIGELRAKTQVSVLLITHDLGIVARVADRVAVLQDGLITKTGKTSDMLRSPSSDFVPRMPGGAKGGTPKEAESSRSLLVEARDLTKWFNSIGPFFKAPSRIAALDRVSISIGEDESVGLVGESGSGKTTLARCLCGLTVPEEGTVVVRGRDIAVPRASRVPASSAVQMVFQDPYSSLNPTMSVGRAIGEGLRAHGTDEPEVRRQSLDMLEHVGLNDDYFDRLPAQLSGGERQRVAIGRALIIRPSLLIADEPVSALDLSVQSVILDLLAGLREEYGMSLLLISHDVNLIARVCSRIYVMYRGRIVEEGPTSTLLRSPTHTYTQLLVSMARELSMS